MGSRKKLRGIENSETQELQIVIDEEPVSAVRHTNYLRTEVDQFLNWDNNIPSVKKISKEMGMLKKVSLSHISDRTVPCGDSVVPSHQIEAFIIW